MLTFYFCYYYDYCAYTASKSPVSTVAKSSQVSGVKTQRDRLTVRSVHSSTVSGCVASRGITLTWVALDQWHKIRLGTKGGEKKEKEKKNSQSPGRALFPLCIAWFDDVTRLTQWRSSLVPYPNGAVTFRHCRMGRGVGEWSSGGGGVWNKNDC